MRKSDRKAVRSEKSDGRWEGCFLTPLIFTAKSSDRKAGRKSDRKAVRSEKSDGRREECFLVFLYLIIFTAKSEREDAKEESVKWVN